VNSLPKTVTRQRRGCDLNPGPSVPESCTLTTRLPSSSTKNKVSTLLLLLLLPPLLLLRLQQRLLASVGICCGVRCCCGAWRKWQRLGGRTRRRCVWIWCGLSVQLWSSPALVVLRSARRLRLRNIVRHVLSAAGRGGDSVAHG